jgi:hypothetical protein
MGFINARDSNLYHAEKGEGLPVLPTRPAAFRETAHRRWRRQASTVARAVPAGRARAKADPARGVAPVDGEALRDLAATVAADVRLVRVPVNQRPWTPTGLAVAAGDDVSWLAWGSPHLIWPLSVAVRPRLTLRGRVDDGAPQDGARDTLTFRADRAGELRLSSVYPGELQADGTITTDRIPYRAMAGTLSAVVARWAPGTDPQRALASIAGRDRSGLCAAEAARLADPPSLGSAGPKVPQPGSRGFRAAGRTRIRVRLRVFPRCQGGGAAALWDQGPLPAAAKRRGEGQWNVIGASWSDTSSCTTQVIWTA